MKIAGLWGKLRRVQRTATGNTASSLTPRHVLAIGNAGIVLLQISNAHSLYCITMQLTPATGQIMYLTARNIVSWFWRLFLCFYFKVRRFRGLYIATVKRIYATYLLDGLLSFTKPFSIICFLIHSHMQGCRQRSYSDREILCTLLALRRWLPSPPALLCWTGLQSWHPQVRIRPHCSWLWASTVRCWIWRRRTFWSQAKSPLAVTPAPLAVASSQIAASSSDAASCPTHSANCTASIAAVSSGRPRSTAPFAASISARTCGSTVPTSVGSTADRNPWIWVRRRRDYGSTHHATSTQEAHPVRKVGNLYT